MKKRVLSLLAALTLMAWTMPATYAEETQAQENVSQTVTYTLSLEDAIKMAQERDPGYESADTTIKNAERQLEQAKKDQRNIKGAIRLPAGIANVAVKQGYYVAQAEVGVESANRAKKQLQSSNAYSITQQYYSVKLAEALLENLKVSYGLALDNKNTVDTQFSLGLASEIDVKNAQYSVNEMKASVDKSERNLNLAKKSLAAAIFIEEDNFILNLTDDIEYKEFSADLSEDTKKAMETRYDIYQLKSAYTQAEKYMEVTILLGATSPQHSAANQAKVAAETNYKNAMKLIGISINSSYNSILDARDALKLAEEKLALRQQEYDAAVVQHGLGMITNSQLTGVMSNVTAAQIELENAKLTYKLAVEKYGYEITLGITNQ